MLILSIEIDAAPIVIGENVQVMVTSIEGRRVRLGFIAPPEVRIYRGNFDPHRMRVNGPGFTHHKPDPERAEAIRSLMLAFPKLTTCDLVEWSSGVSKLLAFRAEVGTKKMGKANEAWGCGGESGHGVADSIASGLGGIQLLIGG